MSTNDSEQPDGPPSLSKTRSEDNERDCQSMNKALRVCLFVGLSFLGPIFFPAATLAGFGVFPSSISFGSLSVNTVSSSATIVITDTSDQSTVISSVTSSLPEFVVSGISTPISLADTVSLRSHTQRNAGCRKSRR